MAARLAQNPQKSSRFCGVSYCNNFPETPSHHENNLRTFSGRSSSWKIKRRSSAFNAGLTNPSHKIIIEATLCSRLVRFFGVKVLIASRDVRDFVISYRCYYIAVPRGFVEAEDFQTASDLTAIVRVATKVRQSGERDLGFEVWQGNRLVHRQESVDVHSPV